jgi:hypothetical protein
MKRLLTHVAAALVACAATVATISVMEPSPSRDIVGVPDVFPRLQLHADRPRLGGKAPAGHLQRDWYTAQLDRLGEPRFERPTGDDDVDVIRFVWLRSFFPAVAITLTRDADTVELRCNVDHAPNGLPKLTTSTRHRSEWGALVRLLDAGRFAQEPEVFLGMDGEDGARWIIEVRSSQATQTVDRWSPDDGVVLHAGLTLLEMCGGTFEPIF